MFCIYCIKFSSVSSDMAFSLVTDKIYSFITCFHRFQDWSKAVYWLDKVMNTTTEDEEGNFDGTMDDPQYQLVARQAFMYHNGGYCLEKDPNKAGKGI